MTWEVHSVLDYTMLRPWQSYTCMLGHIMLLITPAGKMCVRLASHNASCSVTATQAAEPEFDPWGFYLVWLHSTHHKHTPTHSQRVAPILVFYRRWGLGAPVKICHYIADVGVCWRLQEHWQPLGLLQPDKRIVWLFNTDVMWHVTLHPLETQETEREKKSYLHHIGNWLKWRPSTVSEEDLDQL